MLYRFLILFSLSFNAFASDLDLSHHVNSEPFYGASSVQTDLKPTIMLVQSWEMRASKQRRERREKMNDSKTANEVEPEKSAIPAILGCAIFGMSMYGDSSSWRVAGATLCGFGLAY